MGGTVRKPPTKANRSLLNAASTALTDTEAVLGVAKDISGFGDLGLEIELDEGAALTGTATFYVYISSDETVTTAPTATTLMFPVWIYTDDAMAQVAITMVAQTVNRIFVPLLGVSGKWIIVTGKMGAGEACTVKQIAWVGNANMT